MFAQPTGARIPPISRWVVCVFTVGVLPHLVQADGPGQEKINSAADQETSSASREIERAVVRVSIAATSKVGERAMLSMTIRNDDDDPIVCSEIPPFPAAGMVMKLENADTGAAIDPTPTGKPALEFLERPEGSVGMQVLKKGDEMTWTVDLRRYFQMTHGNVRFSARFPLEKIVPKEETERIINIDVDGPRFTISD